MITKLVTSYKTIAVIDGVNTTALEKYKLVKSFGGKAAGLYTLAKSGINVPPALLVPTQASKKIKTQSKHTEFITNQLAPKYAQVFSDTDLVSVRSGAPVSMPGMMDTILNVGITTENMRDLAAVIGEPAFYDCLSRYLTMIGDTYYRLDMPIIRTAPTRKSTEQLIEKYFTSNSLDTFMTSRQNQLLATVWAVFSSFYSERACHYRKIHNLSDAMGTGVVIQKMVFGNLNDQSCSGVCFTRCPMTGEAKPVINFLPKAQGEDVVAGTHTPLSGSDLKEWNPNVYDELLDVCDKLEDSNKEMMDIEFTVESGKLYILQSRIGKRSTRAKFAIARDMYAAKTITLAQARSRLTIGDFEKLKTLSVDTLEPPTHTGVAVCSGAFSGPVLTDPKQAEKAAFPYILLMDTTTPDDLKAITGAAAVITRTGGETSHAAVVTRSLQIPCIVGVKNLGNPKHATIDGGVGAIWADQDHSISDTEADSELYFWLAPKAKEDRPTQVTFTKAGCWEHLYETILIDPSTIQSVGDGVAMIMDALTFPIAILDLREATALDFESDFCDFFKSYDKLPSNSGTIYDAALFVSKEYDVSDMYIVASDKDTEKLFAKLGFRVLSEVNSLSTVLQSENSVLLQGGADIAMANYPDINELVRLKKLDNPSFSLFYPAATYNSKLSNVLSK